MNNEKLQRSLMDKTRPSATTTKNSAKRMPNVTQGLFVELRC